jgi:hypothetical protein
LLLLAVVVLLPLLLRRGGGGHVSLFVWIKWKILCLLCVY